MMSYMMTYAYDIMFLVYDILYDIFTDSVLFKCSPGLFKCGPWPVQMQPYFNQMHALLIPFVYLSILASKSGCKVYYTPYQASCQMHLHPSPSSPPSSFTSSPRSSWLGECLSDFGASLYHSTRLVQAYA